MAQYRYIRPLSEKYRDFTQKKIKQNEEQAPFKFQNIQLPHQQYVKKPPRQLPNPISPSPAVSQKIHPVSPSCWQSFMALFSCANCKCCNKSKSPQKIEHQHLIIPQTVNLQQTKPSKAGKCCIRSFEPQLCQQCVFNLCENCKNKMCLKMRMCENCKNRLCPTCKHHILFASQKIRSYPIRIKNKYNLHFESCTCSQCVSSRNNMAPPHQAIGHQVIGKTSSLNSLSNQIPINDNVHEYQPEIQPMHQNMGDQSAFRRGESNNDFSMVNTIPINDDLHHIPRTQSNNSQLPIPITSDMIMQMAHGNQIPHH